MEPNSLPNVEVLLTRIADLEEGVRLLEAENRQLRDRLGESQRQAAPFRRRESKKVPDGQKKRPGRPKGHPGSYRVVPTHFDEHVDVPLAACPGGGAVRRVEAVEQFVEEIPPIRPRVTRLVTYRGHCDGCGAVHSSHPLQTSTASGAAKVQLGPNARAGRSP